MLRGVDRELEEPLPLGTEQLGVAGREEPVRAFPCVVVLDALARERLGCLAGGLLRREDERHPTAEDALESGTDQRVVRAPEDDRVDVRLLERRGVLAHGFRQLLAEDVVALDERDEPRACHGEQLGARIERADELEVSPTRHRRLGREQADPAIARCEDRGMRLGGEDADHGDGQTALEIRERGRGRRVARGHDELHALRLEVAGDLAREAADFVERPRAVRESRAVAEVHEVLVRQRDETLVENGQTAHPGVEHADGARIHPRDSRSHRGPVRFGPVVKVWLAALAGALALVVGDAAGSPVARQDLTIPMDDGVSIAATLYVPDGAVPAGGWPAIVFLHGLSGNRQQMNALVEGYGFTGGPYAILTFDARGHGESGGLVGIDGPREVADTRAVRDWLAARSDVSDTKIGAWGISYGGGAVLNSLVAGVPWAAVVTVETWTDLFSALMPQGLVKSGLVAGLAGSIPPGKRDPSLVAVQAAAFAGNSAVVRPWTDARSSISKLGSVTTPVFMAQGRRDFLFGIDQGVQAYRAAERPQGALRRTARPRAVGVPGG